MLARFCEIILNIILNTLLFFNKKDKTIKTVKGDISLTTTVKMIEDIKKLSTESKNLYEKSSVQSEHIEDSVRELNTRLDNIEYLLYEKKAELLKNKILSEEHAEEEEDDSG